MGADAPDCSEPTPRDHRRRELIAGRVPSGRGRRRARPGAHDCHRRRRPRRRRDRVSRLWRSEKPGKIATVPHVHSVWPLLDDESRAARRKLLDLAVAAVGGDQRASGDEYPADLDRLTQAALGSPDEAKRLLEAAATLIALAVGGAALDDTADFVREFDEVDFVTEATAFERSVDEMLSDTSLTEHPGSPLGGFPG
jgi:hypothetical protein